ncbi:MAG: hypothetical protein U0441_39080 [Polyangiaceae bacterium]
MVQTRSQRPHPRGLIASARLWTALALLLPAASGCVSAGGGSAEAEDRTGIAAQALGTCNGLGPRWVGTDGFTGACQDPAVDCPCPAATDWIAERAFAVKMPGNASSPPIPPLLSPYCAYTWNGGTPIAPQTILDLQTAVGANVTNLTEDCVVISPQGMPEAEDKLQSYRRERFQAEGRGLGALPEGEDAPATIEVAIADSSPEDATGAIPRGSLLHGHVMGWTARDLTCDAGGPCLTDIRTYLALPHVDEATTDLENGGSFGSRLELAQQLFEAVESWKQDVSDRPRLVLPLALGWDPNLTGTGDLASELVHQALVHAACAGVIVTAAAGNQVGGPTPSEGLVYPAAWQDELAPTEAECLALEGVAAQDELVPGSEYAIFPDALSGVPAASLVTAVGAVDYAGRPIQVTRPHGVPRLTALGFQADAGDPSYPAPRALTGTSVAAIVAGAAAADVWAYAPELTAPEVLAILDATAQPLPEPIDPALCTDPASEVKRVSICEAVAAACALGVSPRCPATPIDCTPVAISKPPVKGLPVVGSSGTSASSAGASAVSWLDPTLGTAIDTAFQGKLVLPPKQVSESPWSLFPGVAATEWVNPQPIDPGCSVCVLNLAASRAYVSMNPAYLSDMAASGTTVSNVTLTVNGTLNLDVPTTKSVVVTLPAASASGDRTTAQLSWTLDREGSTVSVTEQVLVTAW